MRKEISTHALWMALALVLSTTALEAAGDREPSRQPGLELGVENLVVYLWDHVSTAVADGVELLTGYWEPSEAGKGTSQPSGPVDRAPAQADPTLEIPTSEAGYPQIDPNG